MSNKIEVVSMPRELTDEMAEVISDRLRVCGGIADDIWEALKAGNDYAVRKCQELQQRLTAADERADVLEGLLQKSLRSLTPRLAPALIRDIKAALSTEKGSGDE